MLRGIKDEQQNCLECGKSCKNRRSLGNHLNLSHKELGGQMGYVLKHYLNGKIPLCSCNCGQEVSWHRLQYKFNDYVTGHNSRNSPSGCFIGSYRPTPEQIEKRNNSIRQTYKKNKKELSDKIGKAVSEALNSPDHNKNLREAIKRSWVDAPERKADLLRRNLEMLEAGLIGPHAPFKTEWKHNPWTGESEWMHSSWESAFMDTCISRGYPVTKSHGIAIPYDHPDGSLRTYVPDFYAFDDSVLYEVKGRHDEVDTAKWDAAAAFCEERGWRFEVLFQDDFQ